MNNYSSQDDDEPSKEPERLEPLPTLPIRPDFARVQALNDARARTRTVDLAQNLRIVEALRQEAVALGVWPPEDPLMGIEVDIRLARVLNSIQSKHDDS